jgi:hypothetical protein
MQVLIENGGAIVVVAHVVRDDSRLRMLRQRADHVREHIIRQPRHAVVVGLARPHPVARNGWVTSGAGGALAGVVPYREHRAIRPDR